MKKHLRPLILSGIGFVVGILNGLFGAGGGIAAVVLLKKFGFSAAENKSADRMAHATSVALVFALTIFSAALYLLQDRVALNDALPYIPGGIVGSAAGAVLLKKISTLWLKRIFAVFMLYTAFRLVFG